MSNKFEQLKQFVDQQVHTSDECVTTYELKESGTAVTMTATTTLGCGAVLATIQWESVDLAEKHVRKAMLHTHERGVELLTKGQEAPHKAKATRLLKTRKGSLILATGLRSTRKWAIDAKRGKTPTVYLWLGNRRFALSWRP